MNYRDFGKTGLRLSALGMGCMRLPRIGGRNECIDENAAVALIRQAIDGGINYVDTAWNYHGGNGEPLVGKALRDGYRQKTFLATKLPAYLVDERKDMDDFLSRQLQRLETDHIDFYLLHALSRQTWKTVNENGVFEFLEKARREGNIRYAGFSFHDDYPVFDEILNAYDWDFCQIQYNIIDTDYQAGKKGLLQAAAKGIAVIIMEPLRGGGITHNIPE
ncbi:MAG: aldo/keto reductase, partial [Candidatus Marinimicrobia bacterium]|nr:aldo/keto reductase [Candidatus Neomarinimicrobiota bacterium]